MKDHVFKSFLCLVFVAGTCMATTTFENETDLDLALRLNAMPRTWGNFKQVGKSLQSLEILSSKPTEKKKEALLEMTSDDPLKANVLFVLSGGSRGVSSTPATPAQVTQMDKLIKNAARLANTHDIELQTALKPFSLTSKVREPHAAQHIQEVIRRFTAYYQEAAQEKRKSTAAAQQPSAKPLQGLDQIATTLCDHVNKVKGEERVEKKSSWDSLSGNLWVLHDFLPYFNNQHTTDGLWFLRTFGQTRDDGEITPQGKKIMESFAKLSKECYSTILTVFAHLANYNNAALTSDKKITVNPQGSIREGNILREPYDMQHGFTIDTGTLNAADIKRVNDISDRLIEALMPYMKALNEAHPEFTPLTPATFFSQAPQPGWDTSGYLRGFRVVRSFVITYLDASKLEYHDLFQKILDIYATGTSQDIKNFLNPLYTGFHRIFGNSSIIIGDICYHVYDQKFTAEYFAPLFSGADRIVLTSPDKFLNFVETARNHGLPGVVVPKTPELNAYMFIRQEKLDPQWDEVRLGNKGSESVYEIWHKNAPHEIPYCARTLASSDVLTPGEEAGSQILTHYEEIKDLRDIEGSYCLQLKNKGTPEYMAHFLAKNKVEWLNRPRSRASF